MECDPNDRTTNFNTKSKKNEKKKKIKMWKNSVLMLFLYAFVDHMLFI